MITTLSRALSFFTTAEKYTRLPVSEEDWDLCYKTYGEQVEGFEGLDLSMDVFKGIDEAMGGKTMITVSEKTPFAVFHNIKKFVLKTELPHFPDKTE